MRQIGVYRSMLQGAPSNVIAGECMYSLDRAAELLGRKWFGFYRKAPKITTSVTIIAVLIASAFIYFIEQINSIERESKRLKNQNYTKQVQALNDTRANLQSLMAFVDEERQQLKVSQLALQSLKTEHDQLKPLVDTERKAIDALFSAQEARNQSALSTERWTGFGLGVLSSLVASFVWALGIYVASRNREQAM